MTFKGWFPQISPDGKWLAWGKGTLKVADLTTGTVTKIGPGWLPHWIAPDRIAYYVEGADGGVYSIAWKPPAIPVPKLESAQKGVGFKARNGTWGLFNIVEHTLIVNGVKVFTNTAGRGFNVDDGGWWSCVSGNEKRLSRRGAEDLVYPAKIRDVYSGGIVRLMSGALYWTLNPLPHVEGEGNVVPLGVEGNASTAGPRVLIRPWGVADKAIILSGHGDAALTCVVADGHFIGATGDAKGVIRTFKVPTDTPLQPIVPDVPEPPKPDVPRFERHFWASCYKDPLHEGPGNVALCVDAGDIIPAAGPFVVDYLRLAFAGDETNRIVGLYVEAENNTDMATVKAETIRTFANVLGVPSSVPVIAYLGELVPAAPIPGVDVVLLQGRYLPETPDPVAALKAKINAAYDVGLRVGWVLEATDGVFNGAPMGGFTDQHMAWWQDQFAEGIGVHRPDVVFWWAWSRKKDDGPERGLKAHPAALAWVRAIVAAIPPVPVVPPPDPPPPVIPPPEPPGGAMQAYDESLVEQAEAAIIDAYAEAERPPDAARGAVWIARTVYDYCTGMAWASSQAKHMKELRAELGLPAPPWEPTVELPRLKASGQFFALATGGRFTAIQCSDFNLFNRFQSGEDIEPILAQRAECGFNMLRVWTLYDLAASGIGILREPDYNQIPAFLDRCAAHGMYIEFTAYTSLEIPEHWAKLIAAVQGKTNVLLELVNEGDLEVNAINFSRYPRPTGVLASHGSGGSEAQPMTPFWDYATFHTNDASEWWRKTGHNAMEIWNGPTLTNENTRFCDKDASIAHAHDAAAGAALLCAGSCFHSVRGKTSVLFDGATELAARAWVAGAKSVPLSAQVGPYKHRLDLETPDLLRVYQRGDGPVVKIRK